LTKGFFEKIETKEFTMEDIDCVLKIQEELKKSNSYSFLCDKMFIEVLNELQSSGSLFGRIAYIGDKPVGLIFWRYSAEVV